MRLFLCLLTSMIVALIIHELGHMFFAIIVRSKIKNIHIGIGPNIWNNTFIYVHLFLIAGNIECEIDISNKKGIIKMLIVAMGGCIFNGLMFVLGLNLKNGIYSAIFALANLVMCLSSIIPIKGTDMYIALEECGILRDEDK